MRAGECSLLWKVYHDNYSVCVALNPGRPQDYGATIRYRGQQRFLARPAMFLVEPGEAHETLRLSGPGTFAVVALTPTLFKRAWPQHRDPHFGQVIVSRPPMRVAFMSFLDAVDGTSLPDGSFLESLLEPCLEHLISCIEWQPRQDRRGGDPAAVQRVRDYLHAHASQPIPSAVIEAVSGLSRFHISRLFRERYGMAPHAYQIALRVALVQQALRRSRNENLAQLAADLGFADQSHMARFFRRTIGVTPGAFRAVAATG